MAVPSNYRWVSIGSLLVRHREGSAENAPEFTAADLFRALDDRSASDRKYRSYASDSRLMWCEKCDDGDGYFRLLLETGDKNVSGISFFHFENKRSRDVDKEDEEGGHYTAHILIKKEPEANGRHVILVEKVPGIYLSAVKDHFAWACNDDAYQKTAPGPDGRARRYRAIFEIDGLQSRTIRDALENGILKDVEFVSYEDRDGDGHDEPELVEEVIREARWKVGKRVSEEQARGFFRRAYEYLDDWAADVPEAEMLVRIKTGSGQIKRTPIDRTREEVLEQAFIQNEVINDFDERLPSKYADLHPEVLEKIEILGDQLGG